METPTAKRVEVLNFSELKKLPEGTYRVVRTINNDPSDFHTLFNNLEGQELWVRSYSRYVHKRGMFGSSYEPTVEFSIRNKGCDEYNRPLKEDDLEEAKLIQVRMDYKVELYPHRNKEEHQGIAIKAKDSKGNKHRVELNRYTSKTASLVEKDGSFFVDHHGVLFRHDMYVEKSSWRGEEVSTLYSSLREMPVLFPDRDSKNRFLKVINETLYKLNLDLGKTEGISKTLNSIKSFSDKISNDDVISKIAFKMAAEGSNKTITNVKFSVAFNKVFSGITMQEQFDEKLKSLSAVLESIDYVDERTYLEKVLDNLPDARDVKKDALKRKSTGAINKIMDDLDFIRIDKEKYPLTHEAIFSGEIPKGTFFRKAGDSYFVYNDNWDIWEKMLLLHKETAIEIATEASRRTTYEKDLMSYFYFVLHKLPEYLEKQTGKKWKCFPKLVDSENELDPPTEGSNGVSKSRSALTPIVDNEKNEVIVPYVSMRLSGYQTSYCYALDFNVLERGMSFKGNVVTKDVEKNLNGRDDYGLMFYTLTGSAQAQGYPTFLIIFEHLDNGTRVHFHRTHPMRSKAGEYNPIHAWTIGCYKWMVGNVNFERIIAQQGDLVFVAIEPPKVPSTLAGDFDKLIGAGNITGDPAAVFTEVNAYDNHKFATPVKFLPYTKKEKSNILGYFRIEKDTMLNHHEHKPRLIPAGDYELRQCRSWEANPKGIWSLRID